MRFLSRTTCITLVLSFTSSLIIGQDQAGNNWITAEGLFTSDSIEFKELNINAATIIQAEQDGYIYINDPTIGLLKFDGERAIEVQAYVGNELIHIPPLKCFKQFSSGVFHAIDINGHYIRFSENSSYTSIKDPRLSNTQAIIESKDGKTWFLGDSLFLLDKDQIINSGFPGSRHFYNYSDSLLFLHSNNWWSNYNSDFNLKPESRISCIDLINKSCVDFVFEEYPISRGFVATDKHSIIFSGAYQGLRGIIKMDLQSKKSVLLLPDSYSGYLYFKNSHLYILNFDGLYQVQLDSTTKVKKLFSHRGPPMEFEIDPYNNIWWNDFDKLRIYKPKVFHTAILPVKPAESRYRNLGILEKANNARYLDRNHRIWYYGVNEKLNSYNFLLETYDSIDISQFYDRDKHALGEYYYYTGGTDTILSEVPYNIINCITEQDSSGFFLGIDNKLFFLSLQKKGIEEILELSDDQDAILDICTLTKNDLILISRKSIFRWSDGIVWKNSSLESFFGTTEYESNFTNYVVDHIILGNHLIIRLLNYLLVVDLSTGRIEYQIPTIIRDDLFHTANLVSLRNDQAFTIIRDSLVTITSEGNLSGIKIPLASKVNYETHITTFDNQLLIYDLDQIYSYNPDQQAFSQIQRFRLFESKKLVAGSIYNWLLNPFKVELLADEPEVLTRLLNENGTPSFDMHYRMLDSFLVISSSNHILYFNENVFRQHLNINNNISSIEINGTPYDLSFTKSDHTYSLSHKQNNIRIRFNGDDLAHSNLHTAYYLTDIDPEWQIELGPSSAAYQNLRPGEYTFYYKCQNRYGRWNMAKTLLFHINPPWWKTGFAYALYILFLSVIVTAIIRIRESNLIRDKKKLEQVVFERTLDIKSQLEEISAQRDEISAQRDLVQSQKEIILSQKQDLTDSIDYAARIQTALIPTKAYLDELIPDYFIFYKPRDVVSGDFYWINKSAEAIVIIGADCTGHGVPGALLSMLGISFLEDIVKNEGITNPGELLNRLRLRIITSLHQTGAPDEIRGGMDIAAITLLPNQNEVLFAGAKNPLYMVLDNQLIENKGDKFSVSFASELIPFSEHRIPFENGSMIYIFSDGFPDQFGGPNRKKYKYARFRELLISISPHGMDTQKEILAKEYDEWRGDIPQIDDVLVMGIKL